MLSYWPPHLLAVWPLADYSPCLFEPRFPHLWNAEDTLVPNVLRCCESWISPEHIVWGKDPTVAHHLPRVSKKNLCSVQDDLASSKISLHAKISGHSWNTPVLSILHSGKLFSGLLSSACIHGPQICPQLSVFQTSQDKGWGSLLQHQMVFV